MGTPHPDPHPLYPTPNTQHPTPHTPRASLSPGVLEIVSSTASGWRALSLSRARSDSAPPPLPPSLGLPRRSPGRLLQQGYVWQPFWTRPRPNKPSVDASVLHDDILTIGTVSFARPEAGSTRSLSPRNGLVLPRPHPPTPFLLAGAGSWTLHPTP